LLTVERVDDYLRVTGYPDGSDWIFRPPRPPERGYGVAGPAHVERRDFVASRLRW
jgi:hypothetical protein